jgi:hypothetical protein
VDNHTLPEYADMPLLFGEARGDDSPAVKLYAERYPELIVRLTHPHIFTPLIVASGRRVPLPRLLQATEDREVQQYLMWKSGPEQTLRRVGYKLPIMRAHGSTAGCSRNVAVLVTYATSRRSKALVSSGSGIVIQRP